MQPPPTPKNLVTHAPKKKTPGLYTLRNRIWALLLLGLAAFLLLAVARPILLASDSSGASASAPGSLVTMLSSLSLRLNSRVTQRGNSQRAHGLNSSRPLVAAPHVPRPHHGDASETCTEVCSVMGHADPPPVPPVHKGRSRVRTHAAQVDASSAAASAEDQWWLRDKELWVDVHTEEDFKRETSTGDKLVVVGRCLIGAWP